MDFFFYQTLYFIFKKYVYTNCSCFKKMEIALVAVFAVVAAVVVSVDGAVVDAMVLVAIVMVSMIIEMTTIMVSTIILKAITKASRNNGSSTYLRNPPTMKMKYLTVESHRE